MKLLLTLLMCLCAAEVQARGSLDTLSPVTTLSAEDIAARGNTNVSDLLRNLPNSTDQALQYQDLNLGQINLRNNLVLINGQRLSKVEPHLRGFTQDLNSIPTAMIDKIEVLKDGAASIYGGDAVSGVVNFITKKDFQFPLDLPTESSGFSSQEQQWLNDKISVGRLGLNQSQGQYSYGLSTYNGNAWGWQPSWKLGETYGLSGPIVALGKTPQGPALNIYNTDGAFLGDVNKAKFEINPQITSQYLIRAQYPTLNPYYTPNDRMYAPSEFNPYGVMVLPKGNMLGDLFQTGDVLNQNLTKFKSYDDYLGNMDMGCMPPYGHELVFPRNVLMGGPNDPFYPQPKEKKKKGGFLSKVAGLIGGEAPAKKSKEPDVKIQYSLPEIGFTSKSDPDSAWNKVDAETKNVTVAVIDSGLYLEHPDGPQYIWRNEKEIAGNSIDDDNNGYVDDVQGWNFLDETNDLTDLRGHGTVVAGIIAAKTNNGEGIAGINPGAVIMPLKVADKNGNTNSLNIFRAVKYAVKHGAQVINISLGAHGLSDLERLAINEARAKGVLVVVASGNSGEDIALHSPASIGTAIAVGAINFDGTRSTVSNHGPNNALMAPGEQIFSLQSKDAPWEGPSGQRERLYTKMSGTSFSAPMVSATASLLLVKNPKLTADDLEDILLNTAQKMEEGAWNDKTGYGMVDASAALDAADKKHFTVKITAVQVMTPPKGKKPDAVDVYATVRGDVDFFTVEVGKGERAGKFRPVLGIAGQQANDDLIAHIPITELRGSKEWIIVVRAKDKNGTEHLAQTLLTLK